MTMLLSLVEVPVLCVVELQHSGANALVAARERWGLVYPRRVPFDFHAFPLWFLHFAAWRLVAGVPACSQAIWNSSLFDSILAVTVGTSWV